MNSKCVRNRMKTFSTIVTYNRSNKEFDNIQQINVNIIMHVACVPVQTSNTSCNFWTRFHPAAAAKYRYRLYRLVVTVIDALNR